MRFTVEATDLLDPKRRYAIVNDAGVIVARCEWRGQADHIAALLNMFGRDAEPTPGEAEEERARDQVLRQERDDAEFGERVPDPQAEAVRAAAARYMAGEQP